MNKQGIFRNISLHYFLLMVLFVSLCSCSKKDLNAPQVTLKGNSNIYLVLNDSYTELGASAMDPEDGELTVFIDGEVDINLAGTYELNYTASDAAGNSGSATRWVHVFNEASTLSGKLKAKSISNLDTINFEAIFSTSTTLNNRIWIQGYGLDSNAVVYADINENQIIIPKQAFSFGANDHFYSGEGFIYYTDSVLININFTDSLSGTLKNGSSTYVKH